MILKEGRLFEFTGWAKIEIDKSEYCIKEIILPSTPDNNLIAVVV